MNNFTKREKFLQDNILKERKASRESSKNPMTIGKDYEEKHRKFSETITNKFDRARKTYENESYNEIKNRLDNLNNE